MTKLGRPILPSGITKIEQGKRRVDVDDLVALAVALEVTPTRLLLGPPPTDGTAEDPAHEEVWEWHPWTDSEGKERAPIPTLRFLEELALEPWEAWAWALGDSPLGEIWRIPEESEVIFPEGLEARFRAANQLPPVRPFFGLADDVQSAIGGIRQAVMEAFDQGLTDEQITQVVEQTKSAWRKENAVRDKVQERYSHFDEDNES